MRNNNKLFHYVVTRTNVCRYSGAVTVTPHSRRYFLQKQSTVSRTVDAVEFVGRRTPHLQSRMKKAFSIAADALGLIAVLALIYFCYHVLAVLEPIR